MYFIKTFKMLSIFSIFNTIFNDAPENWQLGFQDPASPGFSGIIELHNIVGFFLIIVCFSVFVVLLSCITYFNSNRSSLIHKYLNHGTLIETIWTILPALLLIAIAHPSFRLMYLLDNLCYIITEINWNILIHIYLYLYLFINYIIRTKFSGKPDLFLDYLFEKVLCILFIFRGILNEIKFILFIFRVILNEIKARLFVYNIRIIITKRTAVRNRDNWRGPTAGSRRTARQNKRRRRRTY